MSRERRRPPRQRGGRRNDRAGWLTQERTSLDFPLPDLTNFPAVAERAELAIERFSYDRRPTACHHTFRMGAMPPFLCAEHVAAGVLCNVCMGRHVTRHTVDVETRCDGCGETTDGLVRPFVGGFRWSGDLYVPRQGPQAFVGTIVVTTIGLAGCCDHSLASARPT